MEPNPQVQRKETVNNLMHRIALDIEETMYKPGRLEEIKKMLNEKSSEINWDLIELDAAVAIALNDNKEYRKIQKHLRNLLMDYYGPKPDGLIIIATEDMKSLLN